MSTLKVIKGIASKKFENLKRVFEKAPERLDRELPFGLRIGSLVNIDETLFILNDNAKLEYPGNSLMVKAFSTMSLIGDKFYRFYLEDIETGKECFIDVYDEDNVVLFECVDDVHPIDTEEWDFWLSEEDGSIGYPKFNFIGDDDDELAYDRLWDAGDHQTDPVLVDEVIFLDSYGENRVEIDHSMMLYIKNLEHVDAFALLSVEEDGEMASVRVYAGIEINPLTLQ